MTRLWNSSGECVTTFQGHSNAVKSVAFAHADGKLFTLIHNSLDDTIIDHLSNQASEQVIAYSGSLDHSILAWKVISSSALPGIWINAVIVFKRRWHTTMFI